MICSRAMLLAAALVLGATQASPSLAQAPAAPAPGASQPGPEKPAPSTPPAPPTSATPPVAQNADPFGEEVTLPEKTIVYMKGTGNWDSAFATLVDAFKTLDGYVKKQELKTDGPPITVYTSTDDTGFQFQAEIPIEQAPKNAPKGDIAIGKSPGGKAYKFVHRGSYDAMDTTYEAITNFLDDKRLEAKDMFIEEYVTDPVTSPADKLIINVYVPVQ